MNKRSSTKKGKKVSIRQSKSRRKVSRRQNKSRRKVSIRQRSKMRKKSSKLSIKRSNDGVNLKSLLGLAALSIPIVTPSPVATSGACLLNTKVGENVLCPIYNYGDEFKKTSIDDIKLFDIHNLEGGFEIPSGERNFNEENVINYLDNYKSSCKSGSCKELREMMKVIYDTKHITFNDFLHTTHKTVQLFEKTVKDKFATVIGRDEKDYYEFVDRKSNFWVGKMVYNLLDRKPTEVYEGYDSKMPKDTPKPKHKNILYSDDMVYSALQLPEKIENIIKNVDIEDNLYIILPFISSRGIKNLDKSLVYTLKGTKIKVTLFVGEIIQTSNEMPIIGENTHQRERIVFDHKLGDFLSTPYRKYMYGMCPDSYEDKDSDLYSAPYYNEEPLHKSDKKSKMWGEEFKKYKEKQTESREKYKINILNSVPVPYKEPEIIIPSKDLKKLAYSLTDDVKLSRRQGKNIIEKINKDCEKNKTYQSYITDFTGTTCGCETFVEDEETTIEPPKNFKLYTVS